MLTVLVSYGILEKLLFSCIKLLFLLMSPVLTFWFSVCVMTDCTKFIYILFQMIYRSVMFFFHTIIAVLHM